MYNNVYNNDLIKHFLFLSIKFEAKCRWQILFRFCWYDFEILCVDWWIEFVQFCSARVFFTFAFQNMLENSRDACIAFKSCHVTSFNSWFEEFPFCVIIWIRNIECSHPSLCQLFQWMVTIWWHTLYCFQKFNKCYKFLVFCIKYFFRGFLCAEFREAIPDWLW